MSSVHERARREGFTFIVMMQQANSKTWLGAPEEIRLGLRGVTLEEETDEILRQKRTQ